MLAPSGVFAAAGYGVPTLSNRRAEAVYKKYYYETLGSAKEPGEEGCYWDCSRPILDSGHAMHTFAPPFAADSVKRHWIHDKRTLSMDEFIGWMESSSAYNGYKEAVKHDPLPELRRQLEEAVKEGHNVREKKEGEDGGEGEGGGGSGREGDGKVRFTLPFFLILARK